MKKIAIIASLILSGIALGGEQHGGGFLKAVDHQALMNYIYTIQIPDDDYKKLVTRLSVSEEALVPRTELMARKIDQDIIIFSKELGELKVVPRIETSSGAVSESPLVPTPTN